MQKLRFVQSEVIILAISYIIELISIIFVFLVLLLVFLSVILVISSVIIFAIIQENGFKVINQFSGVLSREIDIQDTSESTLVHRINLHITNKKKMLTTWYLKFI